MAGKESESSVLGVIIDERTSRIVLTKKAGIDLWRLPGGLITLEEFPLLSVVQKECQASAIFKAILKDWTYLTVANLKLIMTWEKPVGGEIYIYAGLSDFQQLRKSERIRSFSSDEVPRLNTPMVHRFVFREVLEEIIR